MDELDRVEVLYLWPFIAEETIEIGSDDPEIERIVRVRGFHLVRDYSFIGSPRDALDYYDEGLDLDIIAYDDDVTLLIGPDRTVMRGIVNGAIFASPDLDVSDSIPDDVVEVASWNLIDQYPDGREECIGLDLEDVLRLNRHMGWPHSITGRV